MFHLYLEKFATLKVIMIGKSNVGKTSIINKYVKGVFYEKPNTTVGIDFANKILTKEELKAACTLSNSTCSDMQFLKGSEHKDDSMYANKI